MNTGSDKKLSGLMKLLIAKVDDIDRNEAENIDDVKKKKQIDMEKRGLQDVLSDQTKSLAKKMMKDNDSQTERLEERIADVGMNIMERLEDVKSRQRGSKS